MNTLKLNNKQILGFFEAISVILTAKSEKVIFEKICELLVKKGNILMARVFTLDKIEKKFVPATCYASSKEASEYQKTVLEKVKIDGPYKDSPTAKAFISRKPVIINNTLADPSYGLFKKDAEQLGFLSKAAFPIIYNDNVYGVLTLYAYEENYFDSLVSFIVSHIVDDVAFVINRLKMEEERELLTDELISIRDRYGIILESTKGAIWEYDFLSQKIDFSTDAENFLGIKDIKLNTDVKRLYKLMDENDRKKYVISLFELMKGKRDFLEEIISLNLSNDVHIHLLVRGKVLARSRRKNITKIGGFAADVTSLVHLNERLDRLNKFYKTLSELNQMVIRASSIDEVCTKFCETVVTYGGFEMAFYGGFDENLKDIKKQFYFSINEEAEEYFSKLNVSVRDDNPFGLGPVGKAFRERKPIVLNNALEDESFKMWAAMAKKAGFKSVAAFPVIYNGKTYGIFALYSKMINFFDEELLSLLIEVSRDLGFAFHKLELEDALRDAEKLWRTAIEVANEIIVLFDFNKNEAIKSMKFYELLHYDSDFPDAEDAFFSLVHSMDKGLVGKNRDELIKGRLEAFETELRMRDALDEYKYFYHYVKIFDYNPDGSAAKAIGVFLNIDEIKKEQRKVEELSRYFQLLATVNEKIFNVDIVKKAYSLTVEKIVEYLYVSHAAVVMINKKTLTPKVLAYATKDKNTALKLIELGESVNVGIFDSVLARAYKNKGIEVINNIALDRSTKNFYEEYKRLNIKSIICIPVASEAENIEADYFVIYSDRTDYFDTEKIALLADLAKNLLQAKKKIFLQKLSIKRHKDLIDLERRWKAALDSTNEGVWISYLDTKKVFYSNKWKEMLGYKPDELPDKLSTFYSLMHPDDVEQHKEKIENCKKGKNRGIVNIVRLRAKDGTYRWIQVNGTVYAYDSKGNVIALIGTHSDITELMEMNKVLSQLNSFYEALLLSNRLLIKETNMKLLFYEICKIAVEYGKLFMARVDLVDEKNNSFKEVALYIRDDKSLDYIEELKRLINDFEAKKYSGAMLAIERKDIIIVNDFETDNSVNELFKRATQKANINSAVSFPIFYADRVYAVFTLYSDKKNFFEGNVLDLISYFANDLTYAIERNIESENRRSFEKELEMVYTAINSVNEVAIITDENKHIMMVNESFERVTLFKKDEALGKNIAILNSERHPEEFFRIMDTTLKNVGHWQGEMYIRLKEGAVIPTWTSITVIKDKKNIIKNHIYIMTDLTGRKEIEDKILYLSNYDALTGLPNRVLFFDRLEQSIASARRFNKKFALIYLDIDRFKTINDNLGHHIGDKLLEQIASRLKSIIRGTDTLSRPAGDEFYIIINDIGQFDDVVTVIRKIFDKISEPFNVDGYRLNITASVGVTVYPDDGNNSQVLMRNAEAALYYAKELGRNTYQFYKTEMTAKSKYAFELKNRLKKALENREFVLFYQPRVSIRTHQIVGAEALIRWMHPEKGLIPPNDFIYIAEYSGLIKQIGEWVIEETCRQIQEWKKGGLPEIVVSINISAIQFQDKDLKNQIEINMKKSHISPKQIELELTESIVMKDSETAMQILNALKAMNILISIDDFGTGYSSLSYLKRFPIDIIKIDRSFISSLTGSNIEDVSIVRTIINLGKNLGLRIIAEGVETKEQLKLIEELGCDEYQGYYFSKPIAASEFEKLLSKNLRINN